MVLLILLFILHCNFRGGGGAEEIILVEDIGEVISNVSEEEIIIPEGIVEEEPIIEEIVEEIPEFVEEGIVEEDVSEEIAEETFGEIIDEEVIVEIPDVADIITGGVITAIGRLTGYVTSDLIDEVEGNCSKDNVFVYNIEGEQTIEVENVRTDSKDLSKDVLEIVYEGGDVIVSCDYSEETSLSLNLSKLSLIGDFRVSLVYDSEVFFSEDVSNPLGEVIGDEIIAENVTVDDLNVSVDTTQFAVKINEPVKWKKIVRSKGNKDVKVKLPRKAENIVSYRVSETPLQRIGIQSVSKVEVELLKEEVLDAVDVVVSDNSLYEIEYETPGPKAFESEVNGSKIIVVSDEEEFGYENILAYTNLSREVAGEFVSLFHLVNNDREEVGIVKFDKNNNGLIDYIEWVVPHLSNQTYELVLGENHSLSIYDSVEGSSALVGEEVWFYANYSNESNFIDGATCNISFDDGSYIMDEDSNLYNYSRSFSSTGTYSWNVLCNKTGYATLNVSDLVGVGAQVISQCSNIDESGNYMINQSLSASGTTCINISVSDVELDCNNSIIDGTTSGSGILARGADGARLQNIIIRNCYVNNFREGIYFYYVNNSFIYDSTVNASDWFAFLLQEGDFNYIENLTVINNVDNAFEIGARIREGNHNYITDSRFVDNGVGIGFYTDTLNNSIVNSTFINNSNYAIHFQYSNGNNNIYNNFLNNSVNINITSSSIDSAYNTTLNCAGGSNIIGGSCIGGNYYSQPDGMGYSETCSDTDTNGICDESFDMGSGEVDYLPLTVFMPIQITIISPANRTYVTLSVDFNLSSSENLSSCIFSLDNFAINYSMTINSSLTGANYTNSSMNEGSYTANFWCNDTSGNFSDSKNVMFSVNTSNVYDLIIWDSVEGSSSNVDETVWFYANYTNNSVLISGASCNISFDDGISSIMNEDILSYNYSRNFSSSGTYIWNVSCNRSGYPDLNVSDDVLINLLNNSFVAYPLSGRLYNPTGDYQFNATYNGELEIFNVFFEHDFGGDLANYSPSGNLSNEFYYNYSSFPSFSQGVGYLDYTWKVYFNDTNGNIVASDDFPFRIYKNLFLPFDGDTSSFHEYTQSELSNFSNAIFEMEDYGKVEYLENVDLISLSILIDLTEVFQIENNSIFILGREKQGINKKAEFTFYNIQETSPGLFRDGEYCSECEFVSSSNGNASFNVSDFNYYEYSVGNLYYIKTSNSLSGNSILANDSVNFYVEYMNGSNFIDGSTCNISFSDGTSSLMVESISNYNFSRNFSSAGNYEWNVSCNRTGYPLINQTSSVNVIESDIFVNIITSRVKGVAPLSVFFDAVNTSSTVTVNTFRELDYTWNFGDNDSKLWAYSNKSKNTAKGGVAAHIFENVGLHNVSLEVRDIDGNSYSTNITINVTSEPEVPRTKYCMANTDDFDYPECVGAINITTNLFNLSGLIDSNIMILLRRGDTFTSDTYFDFYNRHNGTIGAYGPCMNPNERGICENAPLINSSAPDLGNGHTAFIQLDVAVNWRFIDIQTRNFVPFGSVGHTENLLSLRIKVGDIPGAIGNGHWDTPGIKRWMLVDSEINNSDGNILYVGSESLAILGNHLSNALDSHVVRIWQSYKGVVSHNIVEGSSLISGTGRQAIKFHGPAEDGLSPSGVGDLLEHRSEYTIISDNLIGSSGPWPVGIGPQDDWKNERLSEIIVERNFFNSNYGRYGRPVTVHLSIWARNVSVRNNIFDGSNTTSDYMGINVETRGYVPPTSGVSIYNNVFYSSLDTVNGIDFINADSYDSTPIFNNILYAPNEDEITFATGNYTNQTNLFQVDPNFINSTGFDFSINESSPAYNNGTTVLVFDDFYGTSRPQGAAYDIGAFEVGVAAAPTYIEFVAPTPADGSSQDETSVEINATINMSDLDEVIFNWDGTNFSLYDDSLVLMYNFDNVSALGEDDTTVVDVSGSGNDGVWVGDLDGDSGVTNSGKYGGGRMFDGDDYVLFSDGPLNQVELDGFSSSVWFKRNALGKEEIIYERQWNNFDMYIDDADDIIDCYLRNSSGFVVRLSGAIILTDIWYHASCSFNQTDKDFRLYINGVKVNNETFTNFDYFVGNDNSDFSIGSRPTGANGFNGTIDEVRLWNRTISEKEVQQLYFMNLRKYDVDKWNLYVNQSYNSTQSLGSGTYSYSVYATNESDNELEARSLTIQDISPVYNFSIFSSIDETSITVNRTVLFYAKYTSDNLLINSATCNITFNDGTSYLMNEDVNLYNHSKNFSEAGVYTWNVTCNKTGINTLTKNSTVLIGPTDPFEENLILWMEFEDDLGDEKLSDSSNENYVGNCSGTCSSLSSDSKQGDYSYNISRGEYFSLGDTSGTSLEMQEMTISFWVNIIDALGEDYILSLCGTTYDYLGGYTIGYDEELERIFFVNDHDGASTSKSVKIRTKEPIYENRWYHITTSWNGENASTYVNGKLSYLDKTSNLGPYSSYPMNYTCDNRELVVGTTSSKNSDRHSNILIDDLRIYNKSLGYTDILRLASGEIKHSFNGDNHLCPKQYGVCAESNQSFTTQWEICDEAHYLVHDSYYEADQERDCSDGLDNDCDGFSDRDDSDCRMFEMTRDNGVKPLAVFFDAKNDFGWNEIEQYEFLWDFGDGSHETGYLAAHVFDDVGDFSVNLIIKNSSNIIYEESRNISVLNFTGRHLCVSNNVTGNEFDDCPSSDSNDYFTNITNAWSNFSTNTSLLFHRGEIFNFTQRYTKSDGVVNGPIIVGSYGIGERPILDGNNDSLFLLTGANDVKIRDLELIHLNSSFGASCSSGSGNCKDNLYYNIKINNTAESRGVLISPSMNGFFMFNSQFYTINNLVLSYTEKGINFAIINNTFDEVTGERFLRLQGAENIILSDNSFTDTIEVNDGSPWDLVTFRGAGYTSKYILVSNNIFERFKWFITLHTRNDNTYGPGRYAIFEQNYFKVQENETNAGSAGLIIGGSDILVRNNIFDNVLQGVSIGDSMAYGGISSNIKVYNNVQYVNDTSTFVYSYTNFTNLSLYNNIIYPVTYDDNHRLFICSSNVLLDTFYSDYNILNLSSSSNIAGNGTSYTLSEWQAIGKDVNSIFVDPQFVSADPRSSDYFRINESSPAFDNGATLSVVFDDFYGTSRPQGDAYDIGAFEYVAAATPTVTTTLTLNDSTLAYGSDSINITWSATTDGVMDAVIFNVTYPNSTIMFESSSDAGEVILTPTNLSVTGSYNVNIWANNTNGSTDSSTDSFSVTDSSYPLWSDNKVSPTSGVLYSPSQMYEFNVTWNDSSIDTILFEHDFSGTLQNYSATGNVSLEYYYDYYNLSAGSYVWRSYANDSLGNLNMTTQFSYVVNQSETNLTLSATSWSVSTGTISNVTCSASNSEVDMSLFRDNSLVDSGMNQVLSDVGILGVNSYDYVCNTSGSQNYSSDSEINTLTVTDKNVVNCSLSFDPISGGTYPVNLNASCSCNNPEINATLYRDGVNISTQNNVFVDLSAGSFDYVCNSSETVNYAVGNNVSIYVVNRAGSEVNLTLDGAEGNITVDGGSTIVINVSIVTPSSGVLEIYLNGTLISSISGDSSLVNNSLFNNLGLYNITGKYNVSENYSSSSETYFVTVVDSVDPAVTLVSPIDGENVYSSTVNFNWTVTDDYDNNLECNLTLDSIVNISGLSSQTTTEYTVTSVSEGLHLWNVSCVDDYSNVNFSITQNFTVDTVIPTIVLNSPINSYNTSVSSIDFNCSINSTSNLANLTLYVWNVSGEYNVSTISVSGTSTSNLWNVNLTSDGDYSWNCLGYGENGFSAWDSINRSLNVNRSASVISGNIVPGIVRNNSQVNFSMSAFNSQLLGSCWAEMILPNSTEMNLTNLCNANYSYTVTKTGRYNITFFANDTHNNEINISDYFYVRAPRNISIRTYSSNNTNTNTTLEIIYPKTNEIIYSNMNESTHNTTLPADNFSVRFKAFEDRFQVTLKEVNIATNYNKSFGIDNPLVIESGYIQTYGVDNSYDVEFSNAVVNFYYDDLSLTSSDKNNLELYKCDNWSFASEVCNGTYYDITSNTTQNSTGDYFEFNVTSFSGFSIKQLEYCGDATCNNGESCSTCVVDCGACDDDDDDGSGGGGSTTITLSNVSVNETTGEIVTGFEKISLKMFVNDSIKRSVSLPEDCVDGYTLDIPFGLRKLINFPEKENENIMDLEFVGSLKGNYYGTIDVICSETTYFFPVELKIFSESGDFFNFDILFEKEEFVAGDTISSVFDFVYNDLNGVYSVKMNYDILDINDNIVWSEANVVTLYGQDKIVKDFVVLEKMPTGKYFLVASLTYGEIRYESRVEFLVVSKKNLMYWFEKVRDIFNENKWLWGIVGFIVLLALLIVVILLKSKRVSKRKSSGKKRKRKGKK